jgi:hypothetical protein
VRLQYNFRLDPTPAQRQASARAFGCARVVFNDGLRARQDAWATGEKRLSDGALSKPPRDPSTRQAPPGPPRPTGATHRVSDSQRRGRSRSGSATGSSVPVDLDSRYNAPITTRSTAHHHRIGTHVPVPVDIRNIAVSDARAPTAKSRKPDEAHRASSDFRSTADTQPTGRRKLDTEDTTQAFPASARSRRPFSYLA